MSALAEGYWTARYVDGELTQWYASLDGEAWYPMSGPLQPEDLAWFRGEITPIVVELGGGAKRTTYKMSFDRAWVEAGGHATIFPPADGGTSCPT